MNIQSTARGERDGRRHGEIVLAESARNDERIFEARYVAGRVGVPFNGEAPYPRVTPGGATHGDFAERRVVMVALEYFAELVVVSLSGDRSPRRHDIAIPQQELAERSRVVSMCF
jgi:hypothetical protein